MAACTFEVIDTEPTAVRAAGTAHCLSTVPHFELLILLCTCWQFLLVELAAGGPYAVILPLLPDDCKATLQPARCRQLQQLHGARCSNSSLQLLHETAVVGAVVCVMCAWLLSSYYYCYFATFQTNCLHVWF
jgi:hypothetical protein